GGSVDRGDVAELGAELEAAERRHPDPTGVVRVRRSTPLDGNRNRVVSPAGEDVSFGPVGGDDTGRAVDGEGDAAVLAGSYLVAERRRDRRCPIGQLGATADVEVRRPDGGLGTRVAEAPTGVRRPDGVKLLGSGSAGHDECLLDRIGRVEGGNGWNGRGWPDSAHRSRPASPVMPFPSKNSPISRSLGSRAKTVTTSKCRAASPQNIVCEGADRERLYIGNDKERKQPNKSAAAETNIV
ncbi:MAG: hypothetical protein KDD44_10200, partial [Bdellovibrionales bacterium]|nr:hypothetical protein [Bdellovibrionales bacterium]